MKKIGANSVKVRQINRGLIMDTLKACESLNIAELAAQTGLSIATCANILPELVKSGEALELVGRESSGGRPARKFAFNSNHTLIASVLLKHGLGRPDLIYAVCNAAGNTVSAGEKSIHNPTLRDLDELFTTIQSQFPIKAVAIALPGVISDGLLLECDIPELAGIHIENHIKKRHGLETVADNDMNFAAVGYHKQHTDIPPAGLAFLVFPADRDPGAGFVVNGMLVRGKTNFAGELSHIPLTQPTISRQAGSAERAAVAAGRTAAAVIAVINPAVIVFSGDSMQPNMHDLVRKTCLETIPERHLPEIVIQPSYESDCFAGMHAMALSCFDSDFKLVEKNRTWCC